MLTNKMMSMRITIKEIILFSLPIIFGQLGQMLIGAGDVLVAGKYSTQVLAAIGVANGIQGPILMTGIGLLMGIAPILSQLRGEGQSSEMHAYDVLFYALMVSIIIVSLQWIFILFLPYFGFSTELTPFIEDYLKITSFSLPGFIFFLALKEFLQSQEKIILPNALSLFAVILNLAGNYLLVFGMYGFPALGEKGLAYMSFITRWFMGGTLFFFCLPYIKISLPISKKMLQAVASLSVPIAFSILAEVLAFSVVSILAGKMDLNQAAAHNVILTLASITFMTPLAVSSAASVKIGHSYGARDAVRLKLLAKICFAISFIFMSFSALTYWTIPTTLLSIFTDDPHVIAIGVKMLVVVAIFQVFDGSQVTLGGILRGMGESKLILITTMIGHWVLGFPLGLYLAYQKHYQVLGLWIGLALGLCFIGVRLLYKTDQRIRNLTFS